MVRLVRVLRVVLDIAVLSTVGYSIPSRGLRPGHVMGRVSHRISHPDVIRSRVRICGRPGPLHRWRIEIPLTVPRPISQWWSSTRADWHYMGFVRWTSDLYYEPHIWGYSGEVLRAAWRAAGKGRKGTGQGKGKGKGKRNLKGNAV